MDVTTAVWLVTALVTVGRPALRRARHRPAPARAVDARVRALPGALRRAGGRLRHRRLVVSAAPQYGGEFFAGWLTEYSLSVDNLFIFIIIMSKFAVPRQYQQTALLIGIVLALVLRGDLHRASAPRRSTQFSWVFYLFGLFLVWTAVNLAREADEEDAQYDEPRLVRYRPPALLGHRRVARRQAVRPRERQADDDADAPRGARPRHDRPASSRSTRSRRSTG